MRLALLADVHANLSALDAVLDAIERERVDATLCLGDIVGYNAQPAEVVGRLRSRPDVIVVAGNHDRDVLRAPMAGTSSQARRVSTWTRDVLDEEARAWLAALPHRHVSAAFVGVHGCYLNDAHVSGYVTDTMLEYNLRAIQRGGYPKLAFCGHTHLPMLGVLRGEQGVDLRLGRDGEASWRGADEVVIVNPGSVGQPRDGDPRASFAIVDVERRTVTLRRVAYDVERTIAAITAADLPRSLGERLRDGR